MDLIIKVATAEKDSFGVEVKKSNYNLILKLLEEERLKIINKLKEYYAAGLIGTIKFPRNKYIQAELDAYVKRKKLIKVSVQQINKLFKGY